MPSTHNRKARPQIPEMPRPSTGHCSVSPISPHTIVLLQLFWAAHGLKGFIPYPPGSCLILLSPIGFGTPSHTSPTFIGSCLLAPSRFLRRKKTANKRVYTGSINRTSNFRQMGGWSHPLHHWCTDSQPERKLCTTFKRRMYVACFNDGHVHAPPFLHLPLLKGTCRICRILARRLGATRNRCRAATIASQ